MGSIPSPALMLPSFSFPYPSALPILVPFTPLHSPSFTLLLYLASYPLLALTWWPFPFSFSSTIPPSPHAFSLCLLPLLSLPSHSALSLPFSFFLAPFWFSTHSLSFLLALRRMSYAFLFIHPSLCYDTCIPFIPLQPFANYSFEELRLFAPKTERCGYIMCFSIAQCNCRVSLYQSF